MIPEAIAKEIHAARTFTALFDANAQSGTVGLSQSQIVERYSGNWLIVQQ